MSEDKAFGRALFRKASAKEKKVEKSEDKKSFFGKLLSGGALRSKLKALKKEK